MEIVGIDHAQLAMPPGEGRAARAFYGGLLGLGEIPRPATLAPGGIWFQGRGAVVHLGVEPAFQPAPRAHLALLVADLEAAREELEEAGYEAVPDDRVEGCRRLFTRDPFGNRLELIQDGDGSLQRGVTAPAP